MSHQRACAAGVVSIIMISAGCDPTASFDTSPMSARKAGTTVQDHPVPIPGREFFPLQLGNRWQYDRVVQFDLIPTGGEDTYRESHRSRVEHLLSQTENLFGRDYVVEQRTHISQDIPPHDTVMDWVRYRQDHSGLYEADVSLSDPPGSDSKLASAGADRTGAVPNLPQEYSLSVSERAAFERAWVNLQMRRSILRSGPVMGINAGRPGGPLDNELTRLRYPLHPGARWDIRNEPGLVIHAVVEGMDRLELPAGTFQAFRIRIVWDFPDFDDTILLWYGPEGFLRIFFHGEADWIGDDGTVLGRLISEEREALVDFDLQRRESPRHASIQR